MLSSGSTEIWFQPELPGLYILHQEMVIFGIFTNFLSNFHQPHLVARQNVTFWRVEQCMSDGEPLALARRKLEKSHSVQEAGFTFKKVEGDLDDALLVGLVDGKQEFLFSFFI